MLLPKIALPRYARVQGEGDLVLANAVFAAIYHFTIWSSSCNLHCSRLSRNVAVSDRTEEPGEQRFWHRQRSNSQWDCLLPIEPTKRFQLFKISVIQRSRIWLES